MLQLHFEVDLTNRQHVGVLLAAVNAIVEFNMRAAGTPTMQGPQHGPMTTAQPGAPAPAAPAPRAPRKPRGGAAAQQPAQQPGQPPQNEPELFPHVHGPVMPGQPAASFGQPVPGGTLGAPPPQAVPNVKEQLHAELRNFSTVCGPMALQGLLNYFGCERSSDLPMERVEEIFQYIRAARAQMQQGQG
jgi:hypothetical protein